MSNDSTPQAPSKTRSLIVNLFFYLIGAVAHYVMSHKLGKTKHRQKIKHATELLDTVPTGNDTFFSSLKKSGQLFEKLAYAEHDVYPSTKEAKEAILAKDPNLVVHKDRTFIQLLIELVTDNGLFEHTEVVAKIGKNNSEANMVVTQYTFTGGRVLYIFRYFYTYGDFLEPEYISNFDCYSLFGDLFKKSSQAVIVSYDEESHKTVIEPLRHEMFSAGEPVTFRGACNTDKLDKLVKEFQQYEDLGEQRTYLLVGAPGTGKTTTCLQLAKQISPNAIIKLDFSLFKAANNDFLHSLLEFSGAKVVIIDDIDRTLGDASLMQKLLYCLESAKGIDTKPVLLATANSVAAMPKALLRPGRFDKIVEFLPPTVEERIQWFLDGSLTEPQLKELVLHTEGLAQAHLKEVSKQLKCGTSVDDVIEDLKLRKKYEEQAVK